VNRNRQLGQASVQSFGLGRGFRRGAKVLVVLGVGLLATGLFAQAASASNQEPTLTATRATFQIKGANPSQKVWDLTLWELGTPQKLLGSDKGTSGLLVVKVPSVSSCSFQVDVTRNGVWYSGFQRQVAFCGGVSVSSTSTSSTMNTVPPSTTATTSHVTVTTKPKTSGKTGGTTPTSGPSTKGGSGSSPTSTPSSKLAFTGAGLALTLVALLGALLLASGLGLLIYARKYPRDA
jgi:hypothetical protein